MPQASLLNFFASSSATAAATADKNTISSLSAIKQRERDGVKDNPLSTTTPGGGRSDRQPTSEDKQVGRIIARRENGCGDYSSSEQSRDTTISDLQSNQQNHNTSGISSPTSEPEQKASSGSTTHFTTYTILPHCPSIAITSIQPFHLPALARLTSTLLPVRYPWSFYSELTPESTAAKVSRMAVYTPPSPAAPAPAPAPAAAVPIGWIRCSLSHSTVDDDDDTNTVPPGEQRRHYEIYIKALCTHPSYRNLGIATAMLDSILEGVHQLESPPPPPPPPPIPSVPAIQISTLSSPSQQTQSSSSNYPPPPRRTHQTQTHPYQDPDLDQDQNQNHTNHNRHHYPNQDQRTQPQPQPHLINQHHNHRNDQHQNQKTHHSSQITQPQTQTQPQPYSQKNQSTPPPPPQQSSSSSPSPTPSPTPSTKTPLKLKLTITITAHVWTHNTAALEWYAKRGFHRVELIPGYYRRLNPGDAWFVQVTTILRR